METVYTLSVTLSRVAGGSGVQVVTDRLVPPPPRLTRPDRMSTGHTLSIHDRCDTVNRQRTHLYTLSTNGVSSSAGPQMCPVTNVHRPG